MGWKTYAIVGGMLTRKPTPNPTRRDFLRSSFVAGGVLLAGFDKLPTLAAKMQAGADAFEGGKHLGNLDFAGESRAPLDALIGSELDARLYSDLSRLTPENPIPPTERFYVRTCASHLLNSEKGWQIQLDGLVDKAATLSMADLKKGARPAGLHLMECSGNARATRFGMISVADWSGAPMSDLLELCKSKPQATSVVVSGFDSYSARSVTSLPGADWVFTVEQLKTSGAFLATEMNGQSLNKDHGAPVRLIVPGWYGCTSIKWVNAITLVDENFLATSQMQEFAGRTHQQGVPKLARDYRPATIDQAAMPIRIEKWFVDGRIKYRVVGILWGGSRPVKALEIRFNPEEDYVRVAHFSQTANDPWCFWSHAWTPTTVGTYLIRLRVADPLVETKRLDSGYYVRSVEVTEI
ncbi:MAG TPA: molybdopterin-dependent oxidoreductase [Candidatus Polarisedimenticolia bacterium]|nr:molybdopterin-dependent oxidoreductase [Candidatus Polarisedimenticolia bacterium]